MRPQTEMTDDPFALGRAKGSTGNNYYLIPGARVRAISQDTWAANYLVLAPWFVESPMLVDQLAIEVTNSSGFGDARVGIYRANRSYQAVGPPLCDSGSLSCTAAGVKTYAPASPILLPRGRYLSAFQTNSGLPEFRLFLAPGPGQAFETGIGTAAEISWRYLSRTYQALPVAPQWNLHSTVAVGSMGHVVVARVRSL